MLASTTTLEARGPIGPLALSGPCQCTTRRGGRHWLVWTLADIHVYTMEPAGPGPGEIYIQASGHLRVGDEGADKGADGGAEWRDLRSAPGHSRGRRDVTVPS